jgi:hypothetical protein
LVEVEVGVEVGVEVEVGVGVGVEVEVGVEVVVVVEVGVVVGVVVGVEVVVEVGVVVVVGVVVSMKQTKQTKPTDVQSLLELIPFDAANVQEAAADNTALFVKAIEYRIDCFRSRSTAKMALEEAEAQKDVDLRKEARATGDKITEKNIEQLLTLSPRIKQKREEYSKAEALDEYSKLVVEAFRMRRDCLRIIGDLSYDGQSMARSAELNAAKLQDTKDRLRNKFPGEA